MCSPSRVGLAGLLALAVACGDDGGEAASGDATGSSSGTSDGSSDASTGAGATFELSGMVGDFITQTGVEGATFCVRGQPDVPCVVSTGGAFVFPEVPGVDVTLQMSHPDYPPHLLEVGVLVDDIRWGSSVVSRTAAQLLVQSAGGEYDPTLGAIALRVQDPVGVPVAGVAATLQPMDAGVGPIYLGETGLPDSSLTETSSAGYYGWANIPPGPHTFTLSHPSSTCRHVRDPEGTGTPMTVEPDTVTITWDHVCN